MTLKRKLMTVLATGAVIGGGLAGFSASPASAACYNQGGTYYCHDRDGTQVRCYWDAGASKNVCIRIYPDGSREFLN